MAIARAGVTLLLAAVSAGVLADSPKKAAWQWTVEERLALRVDARMARERVADERRRIASSSASGSNREKGPVIDRFTGRTHPELFLPHEVFDNLVQMAFARDARFSEVVRNGLPPARHGMPADFWERLGRITTIYVADSQVAKDLSASLRKREGEARRRTEAELEYKYADLCRSRADALALARAEFGPERFDRFLYDVIAVNMFYAADRLPDPVQLARIERGCR